MKRNLIKKGVLEYTETGMQSIEKGKKGKSTSAKATADKSKKKADPEQEINPELPEEDNEQEINPEEETDPEQE
jgi:hypothetical protein